MHANSLSHVRLSVTPWTAVPPGSSVHVDFSRQEYWRGLLFPPPRDLHNPGIEFRSRALQADAFLSEPFIPPPLQSNQEDSEFCAQSHSEDIFCYVFRDSSDVSGRTGSIFFFLFPTRVGNPGSLAISTPRCYVMFVVPFTER